MVILEPQTYQQVPLMLTGLSGEKQKQFGDNMGQVDSELYERILEIQTDLDTVIAKQSNGLRYADSLSVIGNTGGDLNLISATDIPATEVWEVTAVTLSLDAASANWQLQRGTDANYPIMIVTALLTPSTFANTIWLKRGQTLYANEISGAARLYYIITGAKWTIL